MTSIQSTDTRWSESTYNRMMNMAVFAVFMKFILIFGIIMVDPPMETKAAILIGGLGFMILAVFATMIITSRPGYRLSTTGIILGFVGTIGVAVTAMNAAITAIT